MAEVDLDLLQWFRAYLREAGRPEDAAEAGKAIDALEHYKRLEKAARPVAWASTGICASCTPVDGQHADGCPVLALRDALEEE